MKKQILLLIVAFFAVTSAFGQALPGSAPRGILCTDGPLSPIAGKEYTYTASSTQAGNFTFWATKDPNFLSTTAGVTTTNMATTKLNSPTTTPTGTDLLTTSANYAIASATDNVKITWSDAILAATDPATSPTFIAVLKDGTCTNNFNAWQLQPIKAFTVDIINYENAAKTPLAYDIADDQCFDDVRGAAWNGTTMEYDFGTNVLYYEVVAANFTGSYTPTFEINGLGDGQTALLEWSYSNTFASIIGSATLTNGTASTTANGGTTAVVTTNETSTTAGVSIYVRVTLTNGTFEGLSATDIDLAVDGQNSVGDWDIVNNPAAIGDPLQCIATTAADQNDVARQTLNARPNVDAVAPSTPFVPGNQTPAHP